MYNSWFKGEKQRSLCIKDNCQIEYIENSLKKLLPQENLIVISAKINDTGVYNNPLKEKYPPQYAHIFKIENLPEYCEVIVEYKTEKANPIRNIIWLPVEWNRRFIATAGAGNRTGGYFQLANPNDYTRGMTPVVAVLNGFMSATTDGGVHEDGRWAIHNEKCELTEDLVKEWAYLAEHKMTVISKAIAKILYGEYPKYSYLHGASGGGRQSIMEAQRYPKDYNGIWASCPAINWSKFVLGNLWALAVINETGAYLTPSKMLAFEKAVHEKYGGEDKYYKMSEIPQFDSYKLLGVETEDGTITENDCLAMKEIWEGIKDENGNKMWFFFRPGTRFWAEGPSPTSYYFIKDDNGKYKIKNFSLCSDFAGWIDRSMDKTYDKITKSEVRRLVKEGLKQFPYLETSDPDLLEFHKNGGKLVVDHGNGDPLVPCDGTLDYYKNVISKLGEEKTKECFRMFFCNGDGHGDCYSYGPGFTEGVCMNALMDWVEKGISPEELPAVRVNKADGKIIEETRIKAL